MENMQLCEMHTIITLSTIKQTIYMKILTLRVLKHTVDTEQIGNGTPI